MPDKKASAVWNGDLKGGNGTINSESGAPTISKIHLVAEADVPGLENDAFQTITEATKGGHQDLWDGF